MDGWIDRSIDGTIAGLMDRTYRGSSARIKALGNHFLHHFLHDRLVGLLLRLVHDGLSLFRTQLAQLRTQIIHDWFNFN